MDVTDHQCRVLLPALGDGGRVNDVPVLRIRRFRRHSRRSSAPEGERRVRGSVAGALPPDQREFRQSGFLLAFLKRCRAVRARVGVAAVASR